MALDAVLSLPAFSVVTAEPQLARPALVGEIEDQSDGWPGSKEAGSVIVVARTARNGLLTSLRAIL